MPDPTHLPSTSHQAWIGAGVLLVGVALAAGALSIPSAAGYAGVGPNFLPWVVSVALLVCGGLLVREALTGGYREMDAPSGAPRGDWMALAWVSAGVLVNAALITTIGFVLACTLCYVLAVRGLRLSEGRGTTPRHLALDVVAGIAISLPVYWMFTKLLNISLPGLTGTGWL